MDVKKTKSLNIFMGDKQMWSLKMTILFVFIPVKVNVMKLVFVIKRKTKNILKKLVFGGWNQMTLFLFSKLTFYISI